MALARSLDRLIPFILNLPLGVYNTMSPAPKGRDLTSIYWILDTG
jgi:hypothetical protein